MATLRSSLPSHFPPSQELAPPGPWYWRQNPGKGPSFLFCNSLNSLPTLITVCGHLHSKWRSKHQKMASLMTTSTPFSPSATSSRRVRVTTLLQYLGPGWAHPGECQIISKCWPFYKFTHDNEHDLKYKLYPWPRTLHWAPDSKCLVFPLEDFRHVWN